MKIGYLGPEGSNSELMASALFGNDVKDIELVPCSAFGLTTALKNDEFGGVVVPVESSSDGFVNLLWRILSRENFDTEWIFVDWEIIFPVKHYLLGFGRLRDVGYVYSHPQAIGQCYDFLDNLDVSAIETGSTSEAVQLMSRNQHINEAAIGTKRAGELYQVPIMQDINGSNMTRFLVLRKKSVAFSTNQSSYSYVSSANLSRLYKTLVAFSLENKPAALYWSLGALAYHGVNMTMIHSYPKAKANTLGKYMFFIDIEGSLEDENLKKALKDLETRVDSLHIFNSYPVCEMYDVE